MIVNVGLLFAWSCMCLMNTLDASDLLEKVVKITNVHEHDDVTESIKVRQFRSRFPKGETGTQLNDNVMNSFKFRCVIYKHEHEQPMTLNNA